MEENTQQTNKSNKNLILIGVVAVIIIAAVAVAGFIMMKPKNDVTVQAPANNEGSDTVESAQTGDTMEEVTYADGTYEAIGEYSYHSGTETIGVSITLESGIITEAEVENQAVAPTSKKIQDDFIANFKEMVIGKDIAGLEIGKVSGSSLTPIGFNAALEDIRAQAEVSS